jgi:outer membrane protein assembly factor BamB
VTNTWDASPDGSDSYLGTFDLLNGTVTEFENPLGVTKMMALEFDNNGTLYGGSWDTDFLYTIDTATGSPTQVGTSGLGFDDVMDFALDSSGTLWAVAAGPSTFPSYLYTIDLDSGSETYGEGTYVTTITGTALDSFVMGIMFGADDTLYATEMAFENEISKLYTIDTSSGEATGVGTGTVIKYLHGGDILVPEPISSSLFIVGGATLGFRRFWKKRKTA